MTDIRRQLLAAFDIEHREHLGAIRHALGAAAHGKAVDLRDVFRRAHSLKGAARAVDLPVVEDVAHRLEALFSRIMEGDATLDPATISVIELGLDRIEEHVAALAASEPPPSTADATAALDRLLGDSTGGSDITPATTPAVADSDEGEVPEEGDAATEAPLEYLRVPAAHVGRLSATVHDLSAALQAQDTIADALTRAEANIRRLRLGWESLRRQTTALLGSATRGGPPEAAGHRAAKAQFDAVDEELRAFLRDVSALTRAQRHASWTTDGAARRLRDDIERISLVPIESVFVGFGRIARELVRQAGYEADVRLSGMDVEAGRDVLQSLKDPVLHLLRNAVGHGAETAEERARKGKPVKATISLDVTSRGGRLSVTVSDDGRGPDLARIEDLAIRRGLIEPWRRGQPRPSADQLLALVFEPGFSTAETVDHLSGRGMGLSVVAEAARKLHGTVSLQVGQPWGTRAEISVPLSAARQPLLFVGAEGRVHAIPTYGIAQILRLDVRTLESVAGKPALRIEIDGQDVVLPIVGLASLLGSPNMQVPVEGGKVKAVLLRRGLRHCAVAVETLHDVRTMMVGPADMLGLDRDLISGTVLLEDDVPALVLNPEALVERWMRDESRLAAGGLGLAEVQPDAVKPRTTILVVDDSITTRTLEKSILESQGFQVLLSVDGLDALDTLRAADQVIDLVIADVEMPRMDGFALLQAIRADSRFSALPVVMMTSRADPADIRRGLDLGASAYITKQTFDQRELLATIGQLL